MARKRILSTLDTSITYDALGLDIAKEDVALAAFGDDHDEPYFVDKLTFDGLYALLGKLFKNPRAKPDGTKMFCSAFLNDARMCCFFANAIVKY